MLKRIAALIIVVVLAANAILVHAYEDFDIEMFDYIENVKELKLIHGGKKGITPEYLDKRTQKSQLIIMFARLMEVEGEALRFEGKENFADANLVDKKTAKYLAYFYAHPEFGVLGDKENKINPLSYITSEQYYNMLLMTLGYEEGKDYTYDNVIEFAKSLGFVTAISLKEFKNVNMIDATKESFIIPFKDEDLLMTEDVYIMKILKVVRGGKNGISPNYLEKKVQRVQLAIMLLRLLGKEEEAFNFVGTENFADANLVDKKTAKCLAYLYANPEYYAPLRFSPDKENKFNPLSPVTAQEYYNILLCRLGYEEGKDYEYDNIFEFAKSIGFKKVDSTGEFKNINMIEATIEALRIKPKSDYTILAERLVAEGIIKKADYNYQNPYTPIPQLNY